jgi:hypothetical protein
MRLHMRYIPSREFMSSLLLNCNINNDGSVGSDRITNAILEAVKKLEEGGTYAALSMTLTMLWTTCIVTKK